MFMLITLTISCFIIKHQKVNTNKHSKKLVVAFASCPAPRFDEFTSKILGPWTTCNSITSNTNDANKDPSTILPTDQGFEVEEVMRACGGAVQGIKEMELYGHSPDRIYLNRADDGFIYFNCGSYTYGEVFLPKDEMDSKNNMFTSLSFDTLPRTRIVINSMPLSSYNLVRGKNDIVEFENIVNDDDETSFDDIIWECETVCRKSSSSQSWVLQRNIWEKYQYHHDSLPSQTDVEGLISINTNKVDLKGWVRNLQQDQIQSLSDCFNLCSHENIKNFLVTDTSRICQMGALYPLTNEAKAIIRCYDLNGMLKGIILQEGRIKNY